MLQASSFKLYERGFTLIELLVVIFITGILSTMVAVNFQQQRQQQELVNAGNEVISKIREVQNLILTGREVAGGSAADAYEITFNANSQSFTIDYLIDSTRTTLETVTLSQSIEVRQVLVGSSLSSLGASSPGVLRFEAPFAKVKVSGNANWSLEVDLNHKKTGSIRALVVDGISGRIGVK